MRALYCVLLAVALGACAPQITPTAVPQPTEVQAVPTNTLVAAPTEPPTAAPTLEPVALAGPPMEVGSMWPYVDGSILVAVPGGPFLMGHGGADNPEHTVTLSDFWIYQGKVTNQQYALCSKAGKCRPPDPVDDFTFGDIAHANDPVVGVDWQQASDYCTFVHGRLPTEAEWEKTARGPDGNLYPWGANAPACNLLNFNGCIGKITRTTAYPDGQSFYHALDLEGNVYEWVADWYDYNYYKIGAAQDPLGPDTGKQRSVRSASYKSKVDEIPASVRHYNGPTTHRRDLGFRCVVEDPSFFAPLCNVLGSTPGSAEPNCPKVGMGLTAVCQQGKVTVVVTDSRSPDPSAVVSGLEGCSPVSVTPGTFPQVYDCTSDTKASITTVCNYTASSPAGCGSNYTLDATTGTCAWDGSQTSGTECLPGTVYDPLQHCCSLPNGPQTETPICPLGSALGSVDGKPVCIPNEQAVNQPSHSELVHIQDPGTCTGGSTGSCNLTDASCRTACKYGGKLDTATCSCICSTG